MADNEIPQDEVGVYTKDDIDTFTFGAIEQAKNSFLIGLNDMDIYEAKVQLQNLLTLMDTILYKYCGEDKIKSQKITFGTKSYDFYEVKSALNRNDLNQDKIRKICELEYKIYNILIKPFISIPTAHKDSKKKLIERLYSFTANKDDNFYTQFIEDYTVLSKKLRFKDSAFNFRCYCISQMYKYDLDCTILKVGYGRIGKSIFTIQELRRIIAYRMSISLKAADREIERTRIIPDQVIYDKTIDFEQKIGMLSNSFFIFDDAIFVADKRKAMYSEVLEIMEKISTFGSRHHIYFLNIQNLSDLDSRVTDKANIIDVLTERGKAYTYCSFKNISIIKDYFGFEIFAKKPYLLKGSALQIDHNLKRVYSFIRKTKWRDMSLEPLNKFYNRLYEIYYRNKELWQKGKTSGQKSGTLTVIPQDINEYLRQREANEINELIL